MLNKINFGIVGAESDQEVFSIGRITGKNPTLLLLFYEIEKRSQLSLMQWANLSRQGIRRKDESNAAYPSKCSSMRSVVEFDMEFDSKMTRRVPICHSTRLSQV